MQKTDIVISKVFCRLHTEDGDVVKVHRGMVLKLHHIVGTVYQVRLHNSVIMTLDLENRTRKDKIFKVVLKKTQDKEVLLLT